MSLLLDHGHSDAASYPIGMVTDEAALVVARTSAEQAALATLVQAALTTVPNMNVKPSSTKKAAGLFQRIIKMMSGAEAHG